MLRPWRKATILLILLVSGMTGCKKIGHIDPVLLPPPLAPPVPVNPSTLTVHVEANTPNLSVAEPSLPILFEGALLDQDVPQVGPEDFFFKVWRPPLDNFSLTGDTVSLDLQTYFYLAVGDPYDPVVQCGFRHERALHRSIHMESKLTWDQDWHVQSTTTPTLHDPDTDCVLAFFHFNATHILDTALTSALKSGAKGLDDAVAKSTDEKIKAQAMWDKLKTTEAISPGVWLQLLPVKVSAGPITSVPSADPGVYRLASDFALTATPQIIYGTKPQDDATPLPQLSGVLPMVPGINLYPELRLNVDIATALLAQKFPLTVNYGHHQISLTDPKVQLSGSKLVITVQIRSAVNRLQGGHKPILSAIRNAYMHIVYGIDEKKWGDEGQIVLEGTPAFDNGTRDLYSSDLDFDLQSKNALLNAVGWIFHTPLVDLVRQEARWNFGSDADTLRSSLDQQLNTALAPGVNLSGYVETMIGDQVYMQRVGATDLINARLHVTGKASVALH